MNRKDQGSQSLPASTRGSMTAQGRPPANGKTKLFDSSIVSTPRQAVDFITNILESSTEYSMIAKDLEGKILLWNEGARRLYGYEPDEVVGKANSSILHIPEDVRQGLPQQIMRVALEQHKWEGTLARRRKNGEQFAARVVITPRYERTTMNDYWEHTYDVENTHKLVESLLLSIGGCVLGIVLCGWSTSALLHLTPVPIARMTDAGIDARVFAFAIAASLGSTLLFGLIPALDASQVHPHQVLRQGAIRASKNSLRQGLVVAEIALSLILLGALHSGPRRATRAQLESR